MKEFTYKITDPMGMHARPAGLFVKAASGCQCSISIAKGDKSVDAKKIFAVMGLSVKYGEKVRIILDGADEDTAMTTLEEFMKKNL